MEELKVLEHLKNAKPTRLTLSEFEKLHEDLTESYGEPFNY